MRRALLPAFLLVLGGVVLGATVFREQLVHAATTPFQNVVVTNTATNPVPVQQSGTSSVSGTVKIDPAGNTVSLNETDSHNLLSYLSKISTLADRKVVTNVCGVGAFFVMGPGEIGSRLCETSESWDISTIVASGMDDDMIIYFEDRNKLELRLAGSDHDGTSVYQLNLRIPLEVDKIRVDCLNSFENCKFTLNVLGTKS